MIIGSHVKFQKEQLFGCVKEALNYKANTFMFYTGAPHNTMRSVINDDLTIKAHELMIENNIDINKVICHAPYIINLANKGKMDSWIFSISFLKSEILRCRQLGIKNIVVHPGNYMSSSISMGIVNIAEALNQVIDDNNDVCILLETMAGKGTECGSKLEEIKEIIDKINNKKYIGVCVDTCHIFDAGYNLTNYLNIFSEVIGIDYIKCLHINDSKNILESHKDRHENIGYGNVGFNNIINLIYNEQLKDVPKILETPYIEDYPPYKFEIEMILSKNFNMNLKQDVINYYK